MREDDVIESVDDFEYRNVERVAHVYIMPWLLAVGLLGQIINLATLVQARMRALSFIYLRALAIANLISICTLVPFILRHLHGHRTKYFLRIVYHARIELPLINASLAAGTYCIVALTVQRYLGIRHPVLARKFALSSKGTRHLLMGVFFVSLLLYAPAVFQKDILLLRDDGGNATDNHTGETVYKLTRNKNYYDSEAIKIYLPFRETVSRILPIVSLVLLNVLIMISFRRVARTHRRLTGTSAALLSNNHTNNTNNNNNAEVNNALVDSRPRVGGVLVEGKVVLEEILCEDAGDTAEKLAGSAQSRAKKTGRFSLQLPLSPMRYQRRPRSYSADDGLSPGHHSSLHSSRPASRLSMRSFGNNPNVYDSENRVYALLVAAACIFVVCNLPAAALSIFITNTRRRSVTYQTLRAACNLLEVASYTCNFYIYCLCSREYRTALGDLSRRCVRRLKDCCRRSDDNVVMHQDVHSTKKCGIWKQPKTDGRHSGGNATNDESVQTNNRARLLLSPPNFRIKDVPSIVIEESSAAVPSDQNQHDFGLKSVKDDRDVKCGVLPDKILVSRKRSVSVHDIPAIHLFNV